MCVSLNGGISSGKQEFNIQFHNVYKGLGNGKLCLVVQRPNILHDYGRDRAYPASYPMDTRGLFPSDKAAGA